MLSFIVQTLDKLALNSYLFLFLLFLFFLLLLPFLKKDGLVLWPGVFLTKTKGAFLRVHMQTSGSSLAANVYFSLVWKNSLHTGFSRFK